jgi:hypothetical protein
MRERRDPEADARGRTEPTLGDLDHLDAPPSPDDALPPVRAGERPPRTGAATAAPRRRGWLWLLLGVFGIAVAAVWINADRVRGLVPRTELNDVLGRADQALQDGRLDGHDGTSARELYQSALSLQPDSDAAHEGLQRVGRAMLAQADAALQAGQVDAAAAQAAVARELLGGGRDVDQLDRAIAAARAPAPATPDVVDQAQRALAAGKLDGPQGAAALYQRIARADPGSAVAAHGLDQVATALAAQARAALSARDTARAHDRIEQLAALQPASGALPALRAALAQQTEPVAAKPAAPPTEPAAAAALPPPPPVRAAPAIDQRAVDAELRQGQAALRAGRVTGDGDNTALAHFKAALKLDPDNAAARDGLGKIAQALTVQANAATDAGDAAQARQLLEQAALLAPRSADLAAARAHLANASAPSASTPADGSDADAGAAPALSPADSAKVARLVQRAQEASARGDITMPPGDSAYDLYRNALAIDGNNAAALQGVRALPDEVARQFQRALRNGDLRRANAALANYAELAPGDARLAGMSARLTEAWLDQAEQQLGQGDRAGAAQSLDRARKLAPNDPRLRNLGARLAGY